MTQSPPVAAVRPHKSSHHGIERIDPYHWLRAENWQQVMREPDALPAEIRRYLEAENAFTEAGMADTTELRDALFAEMRGRIKEDDQSVPDRHGPYLYGVRYVTGGQHPIYFRSDHQGNAEQVLLDGDAEAAGHAYYKIAGTSHSPDHQVMAWSADENGSEYAVIRFRQIGGDTNLPDTMELTSGQVVWSADAAYCFYVWLDDNHRPCKVFRHKMGTPQADDAVIYEEKDPGFFVSLGETQSNAYLLINAHDHETSELRYLATDTPLAEPVLIAPRRTNLEYSVDHHGDRFFILNNADGAEDFKISTRLVSAAADTPWDDYIDHQPGTLILAHTVLSDHLVRLERAGGLPRIVVHQFSTGHDHTIAFDEQAYALGFHAGYEFDTTAIRFSYSSPTTPQQQFDYDLVSRERQLLKTQEVPSGHDPEKYQTRRVLVPAKDGAEVPVTLLHHVDHPPSAERPCLLYGYGSYGISLPAGFSTSTLSLVDRGMTYAVAHVRGGKDKGFAWYKAGKKEHKTNTFTDFIAVADWLIANQMAAPDRIIAEGGSAGGMLMGAVANMAPDRFAGIIAVVPFVDVLNTMLDDTLPLTPPEWPEWGNPIASPEEYAQIAAYSPYDNITAQHYPAILALGGLTDPRVTYWEPAKWVARLRSTKTDDNPLFLKIHMDSGHGGSAGRFDRLKETALEYAFALKTAGLIANK